MNLDRLWAGWRLEYVTAAGTKPDDGAAGQDACVFCRLPSLSDDDALILERGRHAYTVLNLYPYNTAHSMVVPYRHVASIVDLAEDEAAEVMALTRRTVAAIDEEYQPDGANLGANLGRAAGAGIPSHFHMHALPCWSGDTNFLTSVGGVKVMPEELPDTWRRLHARLAKLPHQAPPGAD